MGPTCWIESSGIGMTFWVVGNSPMPRKSEKSAISDYVLLYLPDIPHYRGTFRNLITHVFIVTSDGMRHAEDSSWHPSHTFFHTASDIGEFRQVI